jgi:uncharacterized protein (TIGR03435 family)
MRSLWVLTSIVVCSTSIGGAQTTSPDVIPAFEVASVKRNRSGSRDSSIATLPTGLVSAVNVTLRMLILNAYRLHRLRLVGGEDWIDNERFDIVAKRPGGAASDQVPLMLQGLLRERFGLRIHTERRSQPVYRLVIARRDGRLGPQAARSSVDCAAVDMARRASGVPVPTAPGTRLPCNARASLTNGQGIIVISGRPISQLVASLVNMVDRVVVDATGLTGAFDLAVQWSVGTRGAPVDVATDDTLSLFTALQEQLGLKLEAGREPVEVLVIDSATRPTAD